MAATRASDGAKSTHARPADVTTSTHPQPARHIFLRSGRMPALHAAHGRQWGFLSPDDCRGKENLPPIPGGDVYHVPVNMVPLGSEPRPGQTPPAKEPTPLTAQTESKDACIGSSDRDADEDEKKKILNSNRASESSASPAAEDLDTADH